MMESSSTRAVRLMLVAAIVFAVLGQVPPAQGEGIEFDDSDPDLIRLRNSAFYEIVIRKSNGSIASVTDKSTGQEVTLGSRGHCLWVAEFTNQATGSPDFVGGCHFNSAESFGYSWSPATHILTLDYDPVPSTKEQVSVQVALTASEEPWFDLQLELHNGSPHELANVLWPSDLVFKEADFEEVLFPVLPGVVLKPGFFDENRSYTARYPGFPGVFADYVSLSSTTGRLAIYSLYGDGPFRQLDIGFIHDEVFASDSTFYRHAFAVKLAPGAAWSSPPVRVRVSQPAFDTVRAYRKDNGLDRFPSLAEKLGSRFTQVLRSPLLKADTVQLGVPFTEYPDLLSPVPAPGILHPVAYQPGGFDRNYPDFLPPAAQWGTTEEMAEMFRHAQARGFLVMPYINPTWWDPDSPTLDPLPPGIDIRDVVVLDQEGMPVTECFNGLCGHVVSPHAPFVRQRLDELMTSMTEDVPSDMLLEDQIGARSWLCDYNAAAPGPLSYIEGWLEHTRTYSDDLLATELGFDRLAETEIGFHGSVLLQTLVPKSMPDTDLWWGADNWRPYPMAPLMVRDKVLFYQHDLAPETFTFKKERLTWNLAFGFMLSYNLFNEADDDNPMEVRGGTDTDWLRWVSLLHRLVLARYADETVTGFRDVTESVTETSFETFTVVANWDEATAFVAGENTLAPQGVQVESSRGDVTAGFFTAYTGQPLSAGDHGLIEVRGCNLITVYQPVGEDTSLTVGLLSEWRPGDSIVVSAHTAAGERIADVPSTVSAEGVTFDYRREISGEPVGYYTARASLPLTTLIFCDGFETGDTSAWSELGG